MYSFLCALNYLHSADVMHRDIKPANILVDKSCNVRICDFGLARNVNNTDPVRNIIHQRQVREKREIQRHIEQEKSKLSKTKRDLSNHVCTRLYRPPEVILLEKQYDQSVDMWAAGCILTEMVMMSSDYRNLSTKVQNDRFIFGGTSCYPLSPAYDKKNN